MKISYTALSVPEKTLEQVVALASGWRLDGIGLRGKESIHISPENSFEYMEKARRLIRQARLSIPCLTAYAKFYQPDEISAIVQAEELMKMVHLAEHLGAATVRTFMGDIPAGMDRERADEIGGTGLSHVARLMGNSPVQVMIETYGSVGDGASMARILDGVPRQIGVLLDILHLWEMGKSIEETWRLIGEQIYHVYLKDITGTVPGGRASCALGSGLLDVGRKTAYLLKKGYGGLFSLEWECPVEGYKGIALEMQMGSLLELEEQLGIGGIR